MSNGMSAAQQGARIAKTENEELTLRRLTAEKIPQLFEPEEYQTVLRMFSRFHRYSYINIILIYLQFAEATYLAGYDTWKNTCLQIWHNPNRFPIKQEHKNKGIRLLAPYTHAVNRQNRRLTTFVVSVFDVSQTNNLPPLEEDAEYIVEAKVHGLLATLRSCSPYRITLAGQENRLLQNGMAAYCDHDNKLIVLDEELRGTKLLAAMIREACKAEMKMLDFNNTDFEDLIAESVTYIINHHFGTFIKTEINNFLFINRYRNRTTDELAAALYAIQLISHKLIEEIESILEELHEYDAYAWVDPEAKLDFELEGVFNEV